MRFIFLFNSDAFTALKFIQMFNVTKNGYNEKNSDLVELTVKHGKGLVIVGKENLLQLKWNYVVSYRQ